MSEKKVAGVANFQRRTWDKEVYIKKTEERDKRGADDDRKRKTTIKFPEEKAPLKARDYEIDLSDRIGKTTVINTNAPGSQQGGFYCKVCDCQIKDSTNFLDHINGKKHQRALGMSMRPERATVSQVKARLQKFKNAPSIEERLGQKNKASTAVSKNTKAKEDTTGTNNRDDGEYGNVDASDDDLDEKAETTTITTKERARGNVNEEEEEEERLSSSVISKKKKPPQQQQQQQQETAASKDRQKKNEKESNSSSTKKEEEAAAGVDDESARMMAMMGLPTGFGTTKK